MPTFYYRAARSDGSILEEQTQAEDENGLRQKLEKDGYLILSVSKAKGMFSFSFDMGSRRYSGRDFLVFNQEFSALLRAGLPIIKIFEVLVERSSHPGFSSALTNIREDIKNGYAISDAMAKERYFFSELYVSSLRAGEKSGNLIEIIGRYIDYQRKLMAVQKKVVSALTYPSILLLLGLGVVVFLLLYVLPSFSEVYRDSQAELPQITLFLLTGVHAVREHVYTILGLFFVSLVGGRLLYLQSWGRRLYDWLLLKIPIIRSIMLMHYVIRITRTLGAVLKSGIPLVPALQMTFEAMTNSVVIGKIQTATERVKEGGTLSNAFAEMQLMPKMALEMISVGEATGGLEELLFQVADFHEDELDLYLSRVTTWFEPMLLAIMGVLIAFVLIAMYLPVFNLAGAIR